MVIGCPRTHSRLRISVRTRDASGTSRQLRLVAVKNKVVVARLRAVGGWSWRRHMDLNESKAPLPKASSWIVICDVHPAFLHLCHTRSSRYNGIREEIHEWDSPSANCFRHPHPIRSCIHEVLPTHRCFSCTYID